MGGARNLAWTATVMFAVTSSAWAQSHIPWVNSWSEAQMLAQRHQRLVLIHFWNHNCPPCAKLDRTVFNQPEVIRAVGTNYIPLKVNVSEQADLASRYHIDRWPTDVIVLATGEEVYRGVSPLDSNRYIALLDQIAAHTRVGMTPEGSPSTEIAMSSTSSPFRRGSDFPLGQGLDQDPLTATPAGAPAADRAAAPTPPPAYVANNYAAPSGAAPPSRAQMQVPEQRASYNASYGGDFQPPAPAAQQYAPNQPPRMASNPYVATPPAARPASPPSANSTAAGAAVGASAGMPPTGQGTNVPPPGVQPPGATPPALGGPASNAALAGPRTAGPMAGEAPAGAAGGPADLAAAKPTIAMDGYCPVTLVEQEKWVKGDPKWGAIHRGRTYLFAGQEEQQRFLANFDKYAPALSGYDPVKYAESGALVDGNRAHGVFYRGQIFLFADEVALQTFWSSPDRFTPYVRAEQQRQAARPDQPRR